jgi:hypothetical protein
MRAGPRAFDETLRAVAELDLLEPSRALDRAVLARARMAAHAARAADRRRRSFCGRVLRLGLAAAISAAALCAFLVQRTTSSSAPPRAGAERLMVLTQRAPAARGQAASSRSGEPARSSAPTLIETSGELGVRMRPAHQREWPRAARFHPPELIDSVATASPRAPSPALRPGAPARKRGTPASR